MSGTTASPSEEGDDGSTGGKSPTDLQDEFDIENPPLSFVSYDTVVDFNLTGEWTSYWYDTGETDGVIDVQALEDGYPDLFENLVENPISALEMASYECNRIHDREDPVRIGNIPDGDVISIENLRSEHLNSLMYVDVQVTNRSNIYNRLAVYRSQCVTCSRTVEIEQPRFGPIEDFDEVCPSRDCDGTMKEGAEMHEWHSAQELIVQDLHEKTGKASPDDIVASLNYDLVGEVEAGDQIRVAAVDVPDTSGDDPSAEHYLHVVGIEHLDEDFSSVDISKEDVEKIEEIAERNDIHDYLANSIAPSLEGDEEYDLARRAILYQLAAGERMDLNGVERGVIHIALVGDPSTGKSKLGRAAHRIAPRSELVSGESVTNVGFTASVEREERFNTTEWTLVGGALVKANDGLCVIDELDKANPEDQKALHNPLSDQRVVVNKASISATLPARTSALVIANPEGQRFNQYDSLVEQIGIKDALFSRFDVVVPFVDYVDSEKDKQVMEKYSSDPSESEETLSEEMLQKYISVAKRQNPVLASDAVDYLKEEYTDLRSLSSGNKMAVTPRQGDAMRRLAQASAKLRLSDTVEVEDTERARNLLLSSLELTATDEYGDLDADLLGPGPSASQREDMQVMEEIVQGLHEAEGEPVVEGKLVEAAREQDIPPHRARGMLSKLHKSNDIWKNGSGYGHPDN